jgi:hypothetical protein
MIFNGTNYAIDAFTADVWAHVAVTWDEAGNLNVYRDGVLDASATGLSAFTSSASLVVGAFAGANNAKGYLDDLVILSRAADAAEIRSIYESDAPVFAESSIEVWRAPTQVPIWVDSEGMWMRAVGGGETLGAYGGDATKSWGGRTLYQSDFLLGNATDGYIHWHAFQDDSDPWGAAGMEVQAQINITGDSRITGTLSVDASEVGIYFNVYDDDDASDGSLFFVNSNGFYVGNRFALDDISGWADFAIAFESQDYGTGAGAFTMGAGDVFIGDANGGANVLWDSSAGQLLFRDGTDTEVYIDTDGSLVTGDGRMRLNSAGGLRIEANTSVYNGVLFFDNDIATRLTTGGLGAYSDTANALAITTWFVSNANNGGNPARIQLEAGDSANRIIIGGILNFEDSMGNSSKNPATDAATDWVECQIGGVTRYLPAYSA